MKKLFTLFSFIFLVVASHAQSVGIGTNAPNTSAQLDIASTTKGLLIPRMTTQQRQAIVSPANGLLVYDTDTKELYHHNGTGWRTIINSLVWTPSQTRRWVYNFSDSVGIGTSTPDARLEVVGNVKTSARIDAGGVVEAAGLSSTGSLYIYGTSLLGGAVTGSSTGLFYGDLTTNADLIINSTTATLQLKSSSENKGYFQLSGDNVRMGTNSGNATGDLIIRMNGTDRIFVDEGGRLGIGRRVGSLVSSTRKLDVDGYINLTGRITSDETGSMPLSPICLGVTSTVNGGIARGSSNVSVTRLSTGRYSILCPSLNSLSIVFVCPFATGTTITALYVEPGRFDVFIRRSDTNEDIDQGFKFIAY